MADFAAFVLRHRVGILTTMVVLAFDQVAKLLVIQALAVGESWTLDGFFRLTRVTNSGSAIELFSGHTIALIDVPPPPAKIADQLLTDFLGANLRFDPLPLNIYAQTEWKDDRPVVTVNSFTGQIPGVKDVEGIQNVAMLHEAVHVERDISELKSGPQLTLPDFGPPTKIVCHRDFRNWRRPGERFSSSGDIPESMREFFAEEAGRAAAVSYQQALSRSEAFQGFCRLGDKGTT